MNGIVPCLLVVSAVVCRRAFGWNPSIRIAEVSRHVYSPKKMTALSLTPRDLERLSGSSGSEDDGEEEAAARAAREALERLWSSSSAKTSHNHPPLMNWIRLIEMEDYKNCRSWRESGKTEKARRSAPVAKKARRSLFDSRSRYRRYKIRGLEVRRESPFPSSSERGALEAAAASQKALVAGTRGLIIDVEVKQLDDEHPEFEPDLMIHFVMEVGKNLATVTGKTKIMLRGNHLATRATETLRRENMQAVETGFDPREDVSFCTMRTRSLDDEGDPDSMDDFAAWVARQISEDQRLVMIVGPRSNADVIVMREVVKAARGRPVVLINPRMAFMPRETSDFDTVYLLRQFSVQPVKKDPRKEARRSPFKITSRQRRQQTIVSELGQVVPKVLMTRAFPDDFKLYVDIDGKGFRLEDTYNEKPHPSVVCLTAQTIIEEAQRKMSMKVRMAAANEKQREIMAMWEEEEEDDDDDDDGDGDGDDIEPRRLNDEDVDAKSRD